MKRILLAEDRDDDVVLLKIALNGVGQPHVLDVATDGEEALTYLKRVLPTVLTKNSEAPDLVLLDIKMPKVDGLEVLQWIRQQPEFLDLPVLMFTSSDRKDDIAKAYSLGANSYVVKTGDLDELSRCLKILLDYWLEVHQRLPNQ
ncbi:response regulator [Pedosphaera parvula]|uniref:Response regulator receiver protein n=1 Tax=Pedosphaera parvula (strain Ellin514) TaxID=320771 RepID=B9XET0_PEDPL|nr:response regulator [Pedosphaera parvula]EEF61794.1 response regulator receiver protein [Pedosphaera parvula Ellin514]